MAESQLVTVAGINKVWSATMALYNKLDHRLDDIGNIYRFQGTKSNWTQFKTDVTSASKGDAWVIDSDYKEFPEDPINYPAYQSGDPGRVHICIQDYTSVSITDDNWYEYWNPVDLNLAIADTDRYGVVRLSSSNDTDTKKYVKGSGGLYVDVPYATHRSGSTQGTVGVLSVGNGLNLNGNEVSLSVASSDPGLSLSDDGVLANTGIKSLSNVVSSGTPTKLTGNLKVETASSQEGAIKFSSDGSNTPSYEIKVKGWSNKQEISTAVTHTANTIAGSSSKPVYVETDGVATAISTISLSGNGNVASFTDSDSSDSAVTITGKTVDNSVTQSALASTSAALKVTGGIICTSGIAANKVYHSVWNDISDAIEVQDTLKTSPGYCYFFDGKEYHRTGKYCQKGIIGIHSDTAGSVLGRKGKHKELDISVGGFVLAYVDKEYAPGTPLTSASNGRLTKMGLISRILHPERLVATYWKKETNKEWGDESHKVEVNGRHWVKVR